MPRKIEFKMPAKLKDYVGEGALPGGYVELFTTFQVKENGDMCIVDWEGVPAPGYEDEMDGDGPMRPGDSPTIKSYRKNMGMTENY